MKRIIMLVLSLALILGAASAPAETTEAAEKEILGRVDVNGAFILQSRVPEGFVYEPLVSSELGLISSLTSADGSLMVTVSIAYSDEYADIERLNDVDDAGIGLIKASFEEMDDVTFDDLETAYGTRLLKVTAVDGTFIDIYTVYKSYEMDFLMVRLESGKQVPLTDADIEMMVDFISDMDFVPAA